MGSNKWSPADIQLLIESVEDIRDLKVIHDIVKFNKSYTYAEITMQWWSLLHDEQYANSSLQLISEAADSVQTEVEPSTTVDSVGHSEADLKTVQDLKDTLAKVTAVPSTVAITPSDGQHLTLPARIGADLTTIAQLEADMTFEHAGNTSQCLLIGREATLPVPFAEVTIGCDGTNSIDLTPYVDGEMVGPKQAVLYVDKKLRETCADDPAVARNGFWRAYNVGNHPFMVNDSVVGPGQRIRVPPGSTIVFGDTPFVFAY